MLYTNGIKADFVVSVDPQEKNTLFLLYSGYKDSILVLESAGSFISLLKYNTGKTVLYDSIFPLYDEMVKYWGNKGRLLSGGSVSTTAFDLARFLECSPIIMIGQDMAFSDKMTHFQGNILEEFLYYRINRFNTYEAYNSRMLLFADKIEINGQKGARVQTDRKFLTFIDWFKREIKATRGKVINATEGGAFIEGADHLNLEKTIELYCGRNLSKEITFLTQNNPDNDFQKYLRDVLMELDQLIPFSSKAVGASENALDAYKNSKDPSVYFNIMSSFDKEMLLSIKAGTGISSTVNPVLLLNNCFIQKLW